MRRPLRIKPICWFEVVVKKLLDLFDDVQRPGTENTAKRPVTGSVQDRSIERPSTVVPCRTRQFWDWSPGGGVPALFSLLGAGTQSLTLAHSLLQIPLSSKVHGVNAIGAPAESHAPLRHAGWVSRQSRTIRRVVSTWC